jgi:hypothetical protein
MRLQKLASASTRSDFDNFASLNMPTVARLEPSPLGGLDGIETLNVSALWGRTGTVDFKAAIAAAFPRFELPPETPDQKRQRAQREIAAGAPSYGRVDASTSDADLDARLAAMESDITRRAGDYDAKMIGSIFSAFGRSDGLAKTYSDLANAMKGDAAELANWRGLSRDQKIELFNRISREANIEVKYNVSVVYGDKKWSEQELIDLDAGLAKMPATLLLDDAKLNVIRRYSALKEGSDDVFARSLGNGDIEFTDIGVAATYRYPGTPGVTETIMHEVGHHFDDENPRWKEFMAISGWRDVGAATDFSKVPNGAAKGKDLGITDDPEGNYVVSRQYGRTWVHKQGAEFGVGSYTQQNPYDDFAETFMQYMHDAANLKRTAPAKYEFIKKFLAERGAFHDPTLPRID